MNRPRYRTRRAGCAARGACGALLVLAALAASGCATPRVDGQWADPAFASRTLRETRVLVACRGPDTTLARLCEDRLATALGEAGAIPVRAPEPIDAAGGHEAVLRAARAAGTPVAVASSITVAAVTQSGFGPSIGVGIGGFGGSGGHVGIGGGFGVSIPLGGVRPATSYAASTVLLDAASGREMWSMRATSPSAESASVQVAALARTGVDAMRRSGLFEPAR
jgi:hypothetical protein